MLLIGTALNVGVKRHGKKNQDNLLVVLPKKSEKNKLPLFILSDGMGGYRGGEIASAITIKAIQKYYNRFWNKQSPEEITKNAILYAHKKIKQKSKRSQKLSKMGSTVVVAIVDDENQKIWIGNVGDSRAYQITEQDIKVISKDHSMVAELQRNGVITEEEARNHPKKNILSMSLALKRETIDPFIQSYQFPPQNALLICSDGLWGVVSDAVIQQAVLELPPQKAASKLVQFANQAGGPDNISIIVVRREQDQLLNLEE